MIPLPGLGRALRRQLDPLLATAAATPGADASRKHFPVTAHLGILLHHGLSGATSLRQTHTTLELLGWAGLDLPAGISVSQLARSSTSRPATVFTAVVTELLVQTRTLAPPDGRRALRLQAIDSTFLPLLATLTPWSRVGRHAAGVKVHVGLDLATAVPTSVRLSLADTHDARAFDQRDWTGLAGWTVVVDQGYYGHARFARLREAGVSWICPLHQQASYHVTTDHPVDPTSTAAGDVIVADQTITLGSPHNRAGAVVPGLRLVTSRNRAGGIRRFVTDRHDLTAAEVATIYRRRWRIELLFRWLKHQLRLTRPLGTSCAAVWLTVLLALIVVLLLALLDEDRPAAVTRIAWLRALGTLFTLLLLIDSS